MYVRVTSWIRIVENFNRSLSIHWYIYERYKIYFTSRVVHLHADLTISATAACGDNNMKKA